MQIIQPRLLDLKAKNTRMCAGIFLIKNRKVLYGLRNYKLEDFKAVSLWTCPAGRCEVGETLGETLARETKEETGIKRINIDNFLGVCPGAKEGDMLYVYVGTTEQEPKLKEPKKFSEWRWFDPGEEIKNFINPSAMRLLRNYLNG